MKNLEVAVTKSVKIILDLYPDNPEKVASELEELASRVRLFGKELVKESK